MKNTFQYSGIAAALASLSVLTGCMHGETFSEFKAQHFESDPWTVEVVEPNDTAVDEVNREFIEEVKVMREKREKFQREVKIVPSQNANAFLNTPRAGGREANRQLLVAFSGNLASEFSGIRDFKIVGTESEALAQMAAPGEITDGAAMPAANNAHVLSFNILSLNTHAVQKQDLATRLVANQVATTTEYEGEINASVALLNPEGEQRMSLTSTISVNGCASESEAQLALVRSAVRDIAKQYLARTSPPTYVSQLRGNGLFAEITTGSDYGIKPGMKVDFYQDVKGTDFTSGKPAVRKTVVGTGVVAESRFISPNTAWVKIDNFHYRKVHLGTFVRIVSENK